MASALPAGRAAHFQLVGPYDGLPRAWAALLAWCAAQKLKLAGANWEIYRDGDDDALAARNVPLRVARLSRRNVPLSDLGSTRYAHAANRTAATLIRRKSWR